MTSQVAKPSEQDARPGPGDVSMCFGCGSFALFDEDMLLRRPIGAEVTYIGTDPKLRAMRLAWRNMHHDDRRTSKGRTT